jgi:hypothetical protein
MKTAVAITLIIAGSFLIGVPVLSDFLQRAQVASLLIHREVSGISLSPTLGDGYRFGCWAAGAAMIAAAIVLSSRKATREN